MCLQQLSVNGKEMWQAVQKCHGLQKHECPHHLRGHITR